MTVAIVELDVEANSSFLGMRLFHFGRTGDLLLLTMVSNMAHNMR